MSKKASNSRLMTKSDPVAAHRRAIWMPAALLVVLLGGVAAVSAFLKPQDPPKANILPVTPAPSALPAIPAAAQEPPTASAAAMQKIVGRWRRPDGGYELMIRQIAPDGTLNAAYFNPRPINVAKATAAADAGKVNVFVELRDQGYPGNNYTLTYDPGTDQLKGIYHHLGIGQEFAVEFVRIP